MENSHKELARDMFEEITEYLDGELAVVCVFIDDVVLYFIACG